MFVSQILTLYYRSLLPLLAVIVVWSSTVPQARADYKYPVGIPKAWIEPDIVRPARPDPWNKEIPGYYFVNQATGNDKGRNNGTPKAPRKSIPKAAMEPGSYTEISGVYNYSNSSGGFVLGASGNGDKWIADTSGPVWIVGSDEGGRASLVKGLILTGSYLCIENVDNKAGNQPWQFSSTNSSLAYKANHMLVRNCEIDGGGITGGTGVAVASNSSETAHDIVFYKNSIHGYGPDIPGDVDRDNHGFFVLNGGHEIWALENSIYKMAGTGMMVATATDGKATTANIYYGRNEVYDTWAAGMAIKTAKHVVFSENTIHDVDYTSWSNAKGIGAQYAFEDFWIINNRIFNCDYGIKIGSTSGNLASVYVIGNVITNIQEEPGGAYGGSAYGSAAMGLWGGFNRTIVGNTIVDCKRGVAIPKANGTRTIVQNNIFSGTSSEDVLIELNSENCLISNNIFYREDATPVIKLGARIEKVSGGAAENVQNNITSNPGFVNALKSNFDLIADSPALSHGLPPGSLASNPYKIYFDLYGLPITKSINGADRGQTEDWDIGAHQRIGGEDHDSKSEAPNKPDGLKEIPEP